MLRYARRIHKLEKSARDASGGSYGNPIDVGGGELGSIAGSINHISAGINAAVEQQVKSERLKTELITNVSHDIRTPLTSIITYTDLLKHEGLGCEKAPEYLDILIQKSQRLKTLIDELFEASKAATGNMEVSITQLDMVSLINQVLGELDGAIKSSGIDLRVRLPERLPVMADGRLMWRVMENLLSNVFKYSLPGSRAYLEASAVRQADNAKQADGMRQEHDAKQADVMRQAYGAKQADDMRQEHGAKQADGMRQAYGAKQADGMRQEYGAKQADGMRQAYGAKQADGMRQEHSPAASPTCFARIDLKNISAEELNVDPSELTERFKRGDDSRADGGSGLGLSIVQSFISAQGGRFAISIDGDLFKASVVLPT